jgi:YfiR/HmsC-like
MIRRASKVMASIMVSAMIIAQAQTPTEYQIKAAFIYNFAKFVEWPSLAGTDLNLPIVVGILGEDPFGQDIEGVINGKTSNGRRLVIKRFSNLQSLAPCHILFVSSSQRNNLRQVFAAVAGSDVLTVGESDRFAESGGVIHFTMIEGKVRLIINHAAAERAGLRISAKLLSLAHVIRN